LASLGRGGGRATGGQEFGATDLLVDTGVTRTGSDESLDTAAAQLAALPRIKEALGPVMEA
jgi:hypothetical protein